MKTTQESHQTANEQNSTALNETITTAIEMLQVQASESLKTDLSGPQGQSWTSSEILRAAVSTLKELTAHTTQSRDIHTTDVIIFPDSPADETSRQEQPPTTYTDQSWRPSALDGLNQLDAIDWEFDEASPNHNDMDSNFLDASMLL